MGTWSVIAVAAQASVALMLLPGAAGAAEIKLLSSGAMRTALEELAPQFERATEHKLAISFAGTNAIASRLQAGETVDVVIAASPVIDTFVEAGRLATRVDLVRSGVGVAVRAGAPKPDIGSAEAFKRTLLAAKSFARSTGPSGVYIARLIEGLGIAEEMKEKTTIVRTGLVAELVAKGEAEIGVQQISELIAVKGVDVSPMPDALQQMTVFAAGLFPATKDSEPVQALIKFLTSPAVYPVIKAKGLEPPHE